MRLFLLLVICGGAGGLVGSMVGAAVGKGALFIGGVVGGLIASPAGAFLAARLKWIDARAAPATAIGAALGFLAAASVAMLTLSSPVGPLLSPLLVGCGGLIGRRVGSKPRATL